METAENIRTDLCAADSVRRKLSISSTGVPVIVLGDSRLVLHHGTVGIVRSLGRLGIPAYCVVSDRWSPAALSRYAAGAFIWKTPGLDARRFVEGMSAISKRLGRNSIVVPTDDVTAILLAENASVLEKDFIFPKQPPALPRVLANKRELYLRCREMGVPCPDTYFSRSIDDIREYSKEGRFPIVVKAAESWLLAPGARTTAIARGPDELLDICRKSGRLNGQNILLQEYIPPPYGEDWFYHGYRNVRTGYSVGFTGRKLRSYPAFAGPTTLGKTVPNQFLCDEANALLNAIGYSGIVDIDYRFDKRDGQYKLVDCNPRIGAQFRLFEDRDGIDVVRALYTDLTGTAVHGSAPVYDNRTFIAEFHDIAAALSYLSKGDLAFREWWPSLHGTRELAWLCRDDPLPFASMCVRLGLRVLSRNLRTRPKSPSASNRPKYLRRGFPSRPDISE